MNDKDVLYTRGRVKNKGVSSERIKGKSVLNDVDKEVWEKNLKLS